MRGRNQEAQAQKLHHQKRVPAPNAAGVSTKPTTLPLCTDRQLVLGQREHGLHQSRTREGLCHGPQKQPHSGLKPGRQAPRPFRPRGRAPARGEHRSAGLHQGAFIPCGVGQASLYKQRRKHRYHLFGDERPPARLRPHHDNLQKKVERRGLS